MSGASSLIRAVPFSGRLFAESRQQMFDALGHVRAFPEPVLDARDIHAQLDFGTAGNRIEQSDAFQAGAALALTAVGHHYVIEGRFLAAAPGQTNRHHAIFTLRSLAADCNEKGPSGARLVQNEASGTESGGHAAR